MKFTEYTIEELQHLTSRTVPQVLDELCDRFDYFFLQTGGKYSIPNHDGHTNQSLKMLGELLVKWKQNRCLTSIEGDKQEFAP